LEKLRPFYDDELVKIVAGIRRGGKSVFLKQVISEIKSKNKTANIIYYDFEDLDNDSFLDAKVLYSDIKKRIAKHKSNYLFFDEIQYVEGFERVVNSARKLQGVSIFMTGSNSKLLSSELSTVLSGRYISLEISPFSFAEVCKLNEIGENDDLSSIFSDYLRFGGLPHRFAFNDSSSMKAYLRDVFDSIVERDIIERANIKNVSLFRSIFGYMASNIGNLFSANNMLSYFAMQKRKLSKDTIYSYLTAITKALIMKECPRYNIHGREILKNISKYYATDIGVAQIKPSRHKENLGSYLENIVYNELQRRGYDVYVGQLPSSEIDFVAQKDDTNHYYQVCAYLDNDTVMEREFSAFDSVPLNLGEKKMLLSLDKTNHSQKDIEHINVIQWLLS
jgi:predicted AAA+ superfamily ATPase